MTHPTPTGDELLPKINHECAFCGGLFAVRERTASDGEEYFTLYRMECMKCGMRTPEFDAMQKVIQKFGRRTPAPSATVGGEISAAIELFKRSSAVLFNHGYVELAQNALDAANTVERTLSTPPAAPGEEYIPVGYQYGFSCPFGGEGIVWRDRPDEWNGKAAVENRVIYVRRALTAPAKKEVGELEGLLAKVPSNYRLNTVDASIEGQFRVVFTLKGQDREDWFAIGEVLNAAGEDTRPPLYIFGSGPSLAAAIRNAMGVGDE